MRNLGTALLSLLTTSGLVAALSPAEWRGQSIYQVMTDRFARTDLSTTAACNTGDQVYCGGTWQGLIKKLDYIQNMGFTAVWISPIVTQLVGDSADGDAYHGYWAQDITTVNSNFGTQADLIALSAALHARGMYLMVDVVTNHMGYLGCGTCVDYSIFKPFNSQSFYHPFCLINYNDVSTIEVCWEGDNIVSLPDLRTEDADVSSVWNSWIADLVQTYGIDGLRVDSAQQVNNAFFPPFQSASGVYIVGEIFNGDPNYVCPFQNFMSGVLNYPAFFWITQAFQSTSGSISNLVNGINTLKGECADTTLMGSFLENHDNPRFPSLTSDMSLKKNAIAFTILQDGIPIIYEGQEQDFSGNGVPFNREAVWTSGYDTSSELYNFIASVNQIRNQAVFKDAGYVLYKAFPIYSDQSTIAMRKGDTGFQVISVFTNQGANAGSSTITLPSSGTGFTANQALVEILSCTSVTTDGSGNLQVAMSGGLPRVFYPAAQIAGSGICTTTTGPTPTCPSSVAITFNELVNTAFGQNIYIVGDTPALGNWAPTSAIPLSASKFTSSNPLWDVTLNQAPGTVIQYKFIEMDTGSSAVTWEADPNHTYTVPCAAATVTSNWQGAL